jgi:hypothetical protein
MNLKKILTILVALFFISSKNIITPSEQLIYKGTFVEVYVEKVIYHSLKYENFLMKFSIKNISNNTVGIDLSDYWKVIYPNQWGLSKKPYREVVDERQLIPDKVIDKSELLNKFKNNKLTYIKPNETLEYYRDWNGSGEKIELNSMDEYLIISVDGQLIVTDGKDLEHITLIDAKETERVIVLGFPLLNKTIPENTLIINKN